MKILVKPLNFVLEQTAFREWWQNAI